MEPIGCDETAAGAVRGGAGGEVSPGRELGTAAVAHKLTQFNLNLKINESKPGSEGSSFQKSKR